ncbi:maleylacetoacetate isomerase [Azospirillum rugosum]|uniref:Maleylacetoacetate isomerase n=1 Tax=Azospirillum rugosum TaxID=416170 RepID=A0ABS4SSY8_9PROT|nr:maleylacetoacetate isomerase [Azospirillum rugosum]MBP2295683.1 maleylacetoacetate isomerase [Azospirillum rugosum]MDQ0529427.1 maleylacetoacetate isomerase [Azospirillum rugosum]
MKLHTYFRSSAAFRVRIALNLKGVTAEQAFVHLRKGEQSAEPFADLNPHKLVPALEVDGRVLTQSLAIIEYLDETHPNPPLLPAHPLDRARVRGLALAVACDIHPLNNLRVLQHLKGGMGHFQAEVDSWYRHWITVGLTGLEAQLAREPETGRFCHGNTPTLADVALVPQLYNARRFGSDLSGYPTLLRIEEACLALPAFADAMPEQQPDAE